MKSTARSTFLYIILLTKGQFPFPHFKNNCKLDVFKKRVRKVIIEMS